MFACSIVLVTALICFVVFNWISFNHESHARLNATGDIIADDVAAALAFGDYGAIEQSLAGLKVDSSIKHAFVLDAQDTVRAYYHQNGLRQTPEAISLRLRNMRAGLHKGYFSLHVQVERPIIKNNIRLGTVCLELDDRVVINKTVFTVTTGLLFLLTLLGLSFLLADRFQRETTGQISNLTRTMVEVSKTKDFSIRVSTRYNKEINLLSECFNDMLSEIAQRDKSLLERHEQLHSLANYDSLTGLPNRAHFLNRLDQALLHPSKSDELIAVLFIDLDGFKLINDTYGHRIGDQLLRMAADRIADQTRASDFFARLGGDEFTVLLRELRSSGNALLVGRKHLENLAKPFVIEGNTMFVTASIGAAIFPDHGATSETLLKHADTAMYLAKEMGKNHIEMFNDELQRTVSKRFSLGNDLRMALSRGEFELYYQPRISLHDKSWTGAEALLRWRHPALGMVPPGTFIPLAEETGLILPIGEWVIGEACKQLKQWHSRGIQIPRLSVNVSSLQFQRQNLLALIKEALTSNDLCSRNIEVEITESAIMKDMEQSSAILRELRRNGVKISLDDFGTGYSSLSSLRGLPIDIVKIDRSFLQNIHKSAQDADFLATIISVAASLHIDVVAEGVECVEQERILMEYGCPEVQGYYYARPLPAGDLEKLFTASPRITAPAIQFPSPLFFG